jgi:uncharacterized protein
MIELAPHADGVVVPVLAHPRARTNALLGERAGALRIAVTEPPEKGKANAAIAALLAEICSCPVSRVSLLTGQASRQKRFLIEGFAPGELHYRIATVVAGLAAKRSRK